MILVGHGSGGLSLIHAMHQFVDRIRQAIFVAATMLPFGLQTDEDKKDVMFISIISVFLCSIFCYFQSHIIIISSYV